MSTYGYLMHYGVKGMQWGVRNYQNPDGTLTAAGKAKYYNADGTRTRAGNAYEAKQYAAKIKADYKVAKSNFKQAKRDRFAGKISRSDYKSIKRNYKDLANDKLVSGNKFNTSKYKLKYRDADRATKTKMAKGNRIKVAVTAYIAGTAGKMLLNDLLKAGLKTAQESKTAGSVSYTLNKGKSAISPNVLGLFVKNLGNQFEGHVNKINKAFDVAYGLGSAIGKGVGKNMSKMPSKAPRISTLGNQKKFYGSYRAL